MSIYRKLLLIIAAGAALLGWSGCQEPPAPPPEVVARVGEQQFTKEELSEALEPLPAGRDTSVARDQIVERWVTNTLLYREALRRGLAAEPAVQQRLEKSRRSVLVSALVDRLYDGAVFKPTEAEMRAYFEQHREQMTLRKPFVRVRHLAARNAAAAESARNALRAAVQQAAADSLWPHIARRWALDAGRAVNLASSFYPERGLFERLPEVRAVLDRLDSGEVSAVFQVGATYHVLQLVDRLPAGAVPKFSWISGDVRRRLLLEHRKQIYARQVQRLRNEARAQDALYIRPGATRE